MKQKSKRVIPGFGISMGVTLTILSIVVLIPLASLVVYTAQLSPSEIIETLTRPRVLASFCVSLLTAFIASAINAVMGVILAWVLVRYKFPLKRILDGMIELPFALPTAVAGIALTSLTADTGLIGKFFARFGIHIAYTRVGITFALIFIGIPFVVRTVNNIIYYSNGRLCQNANARCNNFIIIWCHYAESKNFRRCKMELLSRLGICNTGIWR